MTRTLIAVCVALLCVSTLQAGVVREPMQAFQFSLEIQGAPLGTFRSVEGLGSESEVIEYKSGGDDSTIKIPGRLKYPNITLKRGLTTDKSLATWRALVEDGQIQAARKNGSVVVYDQAHKEIARWNFTNGWPSKVALETDPETGDLVEVFVLAVESIRRP